MRERGRKMAKDIGTTGRALKHSASVLSLVSGVFIACAPATAQDTEPQAEDAAGQEIIVTGTRRDGVTAIESARPVDIVSSDTLERQGSSNLNDALKTAVPSLNVQKFVAQDGSAFVRPFSLRGLPPDQTLVLVNNKRRHRSALVQITNQPLAAGAQGADLSTIPSNAIKSIEVLRDGAAAQYGSDAIAGVINFRLKDDRDGLTVSARYGQYYEGDGQDLTLQANAGLPLTADGFFNISGEYVRAKPTLRGAQRPDAQALINAGNTAVPVPAQRWGNVNTESARLFINSEVQASDSATAYLFGNYSWSTGDTDLPPSEWSKINVILDTEGNEECHSKNTRRRRLSASCVRLRLCWRKVGRQQMRAAGCRSASRPITVGARSMAV